ncbi:EPN1 isoform 6, partial [Pongo abelii]
KPSTNGTTAAGGFDTEPDEFSDFDRLRTALPTSGSSAAYWTPLPPGFYSLNSYRSCFIR